MSICSDHTAGCSARRVVDKGYRLRTRSARPRAHTLDANAVSPLYPALDARRSAGHFSVERAAAAVERASEMITVLVALAAFGIAGLAPVRVAADALSVTVADDSVSVEAVGVPLTDLLARIGEKAHARVFIESILTEDVAKARVSASFTALPMGAALRRLLQGRNFVLVYGSSGVDEIRVYVDGRTGFRALDAAPSGRNTV